LKLKIKNLSEGITIIEIIVVIFLIALFSSIVVFSLQKIQQSMALSRTTHKLAQNLRKAQDLALSGAGLGEMEIAGYGLYIKRDAEVGTLCNTGILIYADSCFAGANNADKNKYTIPYEPSCPDGDYIIDCIDINSENKGVIVKGFNNTVTGDFTSINFTPPNPSIAIENLNSGHSAVEIVLGLESDGSLTKTISVNTAGLIEIK